MWNCLSALGLDTIGILGMGDFFFFERLGMGDLTRKERTYEIQT